MTSFYAVYPFLPGARSRLPQNLSLELVPEPVLDSAARRLRMILSKRPDYRSVLSEKEEVLLYVLMRIMVSLLGSDYYYDRFARFYAERTRLLSYSLDDFFAENGIFIDHLDVPTYMRFRHIYPETKLYHLPVSLGVVHLPPSRVPYFAGTVAYSLVISGLPEDVSSVPPVFKQYAQSAVPVTASKTSAKGWGYIEKILSVSGLPDGKKRILFYWVIPYLTNVKGLSVPEVVSTVQDWLARQGGQKVPISWVRAEAENVKKKGYNPWSLKRVESVDPSLIKLLKDLGVL
jgi:hypothetical protein